MDLPPASIEHPPRTVAGYGVIPTIFLLFEHPAGSQDSRIRLAGDDHHVSLGVSGLGWTKMIPRSLPFFVWPETVIALSSMITGADRLTLPTRPVGIQRETRMMLVFASTGLINLCLRNG